MDLVAQLYSSIKTGALPYILYFLTYQLLHARHEPVRSNLAKSRWVAHEA